MKNRGITMMLPSMEHIEHSRNTPPALHALFLLKVAAVRLFLFGGGKGGSSEGRKELTKTRKVQKVAQSTFCRASFGPPGDTPRLPPGH